MIMNHHQVDWKKGICFHWMNVLFDEIAIALCTASPLDPAPASQFKQDYLRFWPTGDGKTKRFAYETLLLWYLAAKFLKQGDKIGWGILFPSEEDAIAGRNKEQLIICYLTVNRTVGYVRVLYQPVGGLYPVVIAPPNGSSLSLFQQIFSLLLFSQSYQDGFFRNTNFNTRFYSWTNSKHSRWCSTTNRRRTTTSTHCLPK